MKIDIFSTNAVTGLLTRIIAMAIFAFPSLSFSYYQTELITPLAQAQTIEDLFSEGQISITFRARQEYVHDDSFNQLLTLPRFEGRATTLSSKLTFQSAQLCHFYGLMEFNNVTSYFNTRHNSGNDSTPSKVGFAEIADPKGTALDQVYVGYLRIPQTRVTVGRQIIQLDNERFVGNSEFRQMPQTFDSLSIVNHSLSNVELFYGYISQVNSIWQGNERAIFSQRTNNTNLFNVSSRLYPFGNIIAYGYIINDHDIPLNSTNTFGLRYLDNYDFAGFNFYFLAEYARQNERSNNPIDYHANYYHLNGGLRFYILDLATGYEVHSGNQSALNKSFRTPLGSSHIFNGLADKFIVIPSTGLEDLYMNATLTYWQIMLHAQYHYFHAQSGGDTFGHEWDLVVERPFLKHYFVGVEFADFKGRPDNGFADTRKYWATFRAEFG